MNCTNANSKSVPDSEQVKRVIFCTYPSIYSDIVLNELLDAEGIEVVAAVLSTRILHKDYGRLYASWCQIKRSGLCYAAYLFVITDLYHLLCRCLGVTSTRQRLRLANVPVLETKDINDERGVAFLHRQQADVMLSAHFNQLIKAEILQMPKLACLNIHPSLLPDYKGVDPAFYALLNEESRAGVTLHFQEEKFDTGQILQQDVVSVETDDSLLSLNIKLFTQGAITSVLWIKKLTVDSIGVRQEDRQGSYDTWPLEWDVRKLRRRRRLLRWRELLKKLYN